MTIKRWCCAAIVVAGYVGTLSNATAADPPDLFLEYLKNFTWTGAADGTSWQLDGNWTPPTFPALYPYVIPTIPNDPDRTDLLEEEIWPSVGADVSGARATPLTINVGATDMTIASLKLGSTTNPVATTITSSGGRLVFQNNELSDKPPTGSPADTPDIQAFNKSRALIWSTGVAGVNNSFSAPIGIRDNVNIEGDRGVTFNGDIVEINNGGSLSSMVSTATTFINGNILVAEVAPGGDPEQPFRLNSDAGVPLLPFPIPVPRPPAIARNGTLDISGKFIGTGDVEIGNVENRHPLPVSNVLLRANNDQFTGDLTLNRANLVVMNDNALGVAGTNAQLKTGSPNAGFGFNIISDNDARNIGVNTQVAQWQTIRGASGIAGLESIGDHSITFSGPIVQSNTRGWVNLLPAGKTLTISGPQYTIEKQNSTDAARIYTFDGTGLTMVTGGIHDREPGGLTGGAGSIRKRGSGTVVVDYNEANVTDVASDFSGDTFVEGGNLHFGTNTDLGNGVMVASAGAVGVDSGVTANATFLGMFNNSSNPDAPPVTPPFFRTFNGQDALFNNYDHGGLMLAASEYGQNLDFNSVTLATTANMSLAAREGGSTYTGTITPSTTVAVNKNTYQLGGGAGKLTLPNANQLTGARNLLVTNGGEVALTNSNNYTGATKVLSQYASSVTAQAEANDTRATTPALSTTLTVSTLANGGSASSIGSSSNAAANLIVQGGTLKYAGGAVSTDRLFTVGTRGATLDASGSGAVNFANTAALDIQVAPNRSGVWSDALPTTADNEIFGVPSGGPPGLEFSTDDLAPGMVVRNVPLTSDYTDDDSPIVITSVASPHAIRVGETDISADDVSPTSAPAPWPGTTSSGTFIQTFDFGPAPARSLTLSGTNTGNNTLASLIGDAADRDEAGGGGAVGGAGSVGIAKTGAGKWILTGNNTYTGTTTVSAGTLLVNGNQTGAGATTVASGATFGGTGQIGGALTLAAGSTYLAAFAGGTIDSLNVVGNVDLTALANALSITGSGVGTSWTLLTYTGTLTGTFESTPGYSVNYGTGANSLITISLAGPVGVQGDYNGNGIVDAADYSVWRDHLGQTFALSNEGTGVTTGVVTVEDYNFWKTRFGATSGNGSGATSSVPEPTIFSLGLLALAGGLGLTRRLRF